MTYSVYATTAADFMQRFYEPSSTARPSPKPSPSPVSASSPPPTATPSSAPSLHDWIVPALYQQEQGYVPIPPHSVIPSDSQAARCHPEPEPEGSGARDQYLRSRPEGGEAVAFPKAPSASSAATTTSSGLERALRHDDTPWALLTGIGGIGKTTLAIGFGHWYHETGGCPGGVFFTSFREKADFGQVIGSIVGYGTDFSRLPADQQWNQLLTHLRQTPCLLIWDNFETVNGYPEGTTPFATDEERTRLSKFLQALRGGRTRVLITTRKLDENWLNIPTQLLEIPGLTPHDAGILARRILATVGRKPEDFRDDPNYTHLIRLLNGHPRSLEVVLPLLRHQPPAAIIESLQHRTDTLGESLEDASLSYAFSHLSEKAQRHLPILGLFASRVHVGILTGFVAAGDEREEVYTELIGEALDERGWHEVLAEAARCGMLQSYSAELYGLHPTLGPFLRGQLARNAGQEAPAKLDAQFAQFYANLSNSLNPQLRQSDPEAVRIVSMEDPNLLRALRVAMQSEEWKLAQVITQALDESYEATGRYDEQAALLADLLHGVGRSRPEHSEHADFWVYLLGAEANLFLARKDFAAAERAYEEVLNYLIPLDSEKVGRRIPVTYHQLGLVAQFRGQFDAAEVWFHKALEIEETLGLEPEAGGDYLHLGIIAQERGQADTAEAWLLKAVNVWERLGQEENAAKNYHQLGVLAQSRGRFETARTWFFKALDVFERLNLESDAAAVHHQLGTIAYQLDQLEAAEASFRKSLQAKERLGLEAKAASDYHQLGMIAQQRGNLDVAETWFNKAWETYERLNLGREAASAYHHLGVVAQLRGQLDVAEAWFRKALSIWERLGLEQEVASEYHQFGVMAALRNEPQSAEEWFRKALDIRARASSPLQRTITLGAWGILAIQLGQLPAAVARLGQALSIAVEYQSPATNDALRPSARPSPPSANPPSPPPGAGPSPTARTSSNSPSPAGNRILRGGGGADESRRQSLLADAR